MTHDPADRRTWTCDRCGLPILSGQPVYTIADDPEAGRGRHYTCHQKSLDEWDAARRRAPALLAEAEALLAKLKKRL